MARGDGCLLSIKTASLISRLVDHYLFIETAELMNVT